MTLKKGTILIAKDPCTMDDGSGDALIIGQEYKVEDVNGYELMIFDADGEWHIFEFNPSSPNYYLNFFDVRLDK